MLPDPYRWARGTPSDQTRWPARCSTGRGPRRTPHISLFHKSRDTTARAPYRFWWRAVFSIIWTWIL